MVALWRESVGEGDTEQGVEDISGGGVRGVDDCGDDILSVGCSGYI